MADRLNARTPILALLILVIGLGDAIAQNTVVVVPLGGDGRVGSLEAVAMASINVATDSIHAARGTGFSQVTRDSVGIFCLTLDPALGIDVSELVVNVSADWGLSAGDELLVYWNSVNNDCENGGIQIKTYNTFSGTTLADGVSFVATAFWSPDTGPISIVTP